MNLEGTYPLIFCVFHLMQLSAWIAFNRRRSAGRGLERRPNIAREARRADSRNPSRKRGKLTSYASAPYHLQFNDISISLI